MIGGVKLGNHILTITAICHVIMKTRLCNILQFFTAVKNNNFQMKNCDIFSYYAQNFDCGHTLEPPQYCGYTLEPPH